jgi:hypothetical protein
MPLRWEGDALARKIRRASAEAVDDVNRDAAAQAAAAWPRETGASAESIEVLQPAHEEGDRIVGVWGAAMIPPGPYDESSRARVIFNEVGVRGRPGLGILRRSSDANVGRLAGRIKDNL